ncbi:hypothetical protein J6R97_06450 [bacterium]|nr:hypothetical protein [bacterium]
MDGMEFFNIEMKETEIAGWWFEFLRLGDTVCMSSKKNNKNQQVQTHPSVTPDAYKRNLQP